MILDILKYYAQFPNHDKVMDLFLKGSDIEEYDVLKTVIASLPIKSRLPEIDFFVFGQSFDAVKLQVDQILFGSYLFIEVGDITSIKDNRNRVDDKIRMSATLAYKVSNNTDLIEEAIFSNKTLFLLNRLRECMLNDNIPWLKEISSSSEIKPFVVKEFSSIGWTLFFERSGSDLFNLNSKNTL